MALQSHWYTLCSSGVWGGSPINWLSDTINIGLVSSSYTPSQDTDQYWSTPEADEIIGPGYTAGGATLTGKSVGPVTGSHSIPLLASATSWTNASFTCRYAVIYKSTGTNATSPLLGWVDFGGNETVASGTFQLAWDPSLGVLSLTAL